MRHGKFVILAALVALLAFGAVTATAKITKVKKYNSSISVKYKEGNSGDPYDPYGEASFYGKVSSGKNFCKKGRKVKVKVRGTNAKVGSDFTQRKGKNKGKYVIPASGYGPGKYNAKVIKKVKKKVKFIKHGKQKGQKKVKKKICKSANAKITVK